MKLLLIDNEPATRQAIKDLVIAFVPSVSIIEEADGVVNGLEKISYFNPDIVLLDVEMDDGTGFDLMKQVNHPLFQLIFITAHNQYAIQAFKFSAIDYLLKPVDPVALQDAISKAISNLRDKDLQLQLQILIQQMTQKNDTDKKIVLKDSNAAYFIRIADILYCEAEGTYTRFYISGAESILISKNLKEYELLLEPTGFLRTHHSFLINPARIKMYDKADGGTLILENGAAVPISQRKRDHILQLLENKI